MMIKKDLFKKYGKRFYLSDGTGFSTDTYFDTEQEGLEYIKSIKADYPEIDVSGYEIIEM